MLSKLRRSTPKTKGWRGKKTGKASACLGNPTRPEFVSLPKALSTGIPLSGTALTKPRSSRRFWSLYSTRTRIVECRIGAHVASRSRRSPDRARAAACAQAQSLPNSFEVLRAQFSEIADIFASRTWGSNSRRLLTSRPPRRNAAFRWRKAAIAAVGVWRFTRTDVYRSRTPYDRKCPLTCHSRAPLWRSGIPPKGEVAHRAIDCWWSRATPVEHTQRLGLSWSEPVGADRGGLTFDRQAGLSKDESSWPSIDPTVSSLSVRSLKSSWLAIRSTVWRNATTSRAI